MFFSNPTDAFAMAFDMMWEGGDMVEKKKREKGVEWIFWLKNKSKGVYWSFPIMVFFMPSLGLLLPLAIQIHPTWRLVAIHVAVSLCFVHINTYSLYLPIWGLSRLSWEDQAHLPASKMELLHRQILIHHQAHPVLVEQSVCVCKSSDG